LVKVVCDLWNSGIKKAKDLMYLTKVSRYSIIKYLKQGVVLGWCDYHPKEAVRKNIIEINKNKRKPVIQISNIGECINRYESAYEANKQTGINFSSISKCCKGKAKSAGGFKWMYKIDWDKNKYGGIIY